MSVLVFMLFVFVLPFAFISISSLLLWLVKMVSFCHVNLWRNRAFSVTWPSSGWQRCKLQFHFRNPNGGDWWCSLVKCLLGWCWCSRYLGWHQFLLSWWQNKLRLRGIVQHLRMQHRTNKGFSNELTDILVLTWVVAMDPDASLSLHSTEDDSVALSWTGFGLWKRGYLIHVDNILWARGSIAHNVGMAQFQDVAPNQCNSVFMVISLPGNKCLRIANKCLNIFGQIFVYLVKQLTVFFALQA